MINKIFSLIFVIFVSGCAVDFSSTMSDYQGNDRSFIRVDNSFQPTPFRLEKMITDAGCMKSEGVYGLTSKIAVAGIKSSYTKKVDGIALPSEKFLKRGYLEYVIQSGYVYKIWWHFDERSMYGIDLGRTYSSSFMAKKGHSYEIYTEGNEVIIYDLSEGGVSESGNIKECDYKLTMLGKKEYV